MKIINTHAHLGIEAPAASEMTLRGLFNASYVGWQNRLESETEPALTAYFERNSGMRAFHMLVRALEALHGDGEALSPQTWHAFDKRLRAAYARGSSYQTGVLRDICGYERIVQDDYFDIGSGDIFGEEYDFALRCDMFFCGYSKAALLSAEARPNAFFEDVPDNLADYSKKLRDFVWPSVEVPNCAIYHGRPKAAPTGLRFNQRLSNTRLRALKVCMAYFRGLDFSPAPVNPEKVYREANAAHTKAFQDFVMNELCALAAEFDLPLQIHAGLGQGVRTSPNELLPLIKAHPETRFIILHGGFPYRDDLLNVLYLCPNTILDMSWVPLLSMQKALETLIAAIELIGAERVVWGCDANTVEESYGALLAANEMIDAVEARFASWGGDMPDIKEKILYENAKRVFRL